MPKYTYPFIFILNPETELYNGYIPDLAIFAEGSTKEDVCKELEETLNSYMVLANKYKTEIPEPSTYDQIKAKWPGYDISLIITATK